MERPAAGPSPLGSALAIAGGVGACSAAVLVQAVWWWLRRTDWGFDYQGTYEGLQDEIADPWFWSVEAGCVAVVVVVALAALVWGIRSRAVVPVVIVEVVALVALAQLASIRLLLPSAEETTLPSGDSLDFGGEPTEEIAVVDAALARAVGLVVLAIVASVVVERLTSRGRERTQ